MDSIDVVIPLYNCTSYIEHAIYSVQRQVMAVDKIIVVNDGSTDDGALKVTKMAQNDKRIILLNGTNQGLSAARNKGITASEAEFIAFLDADDMWDPQKINKQAPFLSNSRLSFVHTQASAIDIYGKPISTTLYKTNTYAPSFDNIRLGIYSVIGSASSVVTRRKLLLDAGLFDQDQHFGGEDWDMWARLAQYGPAHLVDEPLTKIRLVPSSLQRSMSAEVRARSRLHSRIMVASHWQDDAIFLEKHRIEARKEAWAIMRWLLFKPKELRNFYRYLHHHEKIAGRTIVRGAFDFIALLCTGLFQTMCSIMRSPIECKRLLHRLIDEHRK